MLIILIKAYCVNVVVDIKPIYLNKRYLFQNKIYYLDKGITKPCTHLHPAPSTSTQLHRLPSSSFQPPTSSLLHPQQYLKQNIARNWAISPNLGQKTKSCPFWLKIGTYGILEVLIPNLDPKIPTPKPIFGEIWAQKFEVVHFVWKLVHELSQGCWFKIQT